MVRREETMVFKKFRDSFQINNERPITPVKN